MIWNFKLRIEIHRIRLWPMQNDSAGTPQSQYENLQGSWMGH